MGSKNNNKVYFWISMLAALVGCLADVLLLYSSEGNYHIPGFAFFDSISVKRIQWGYFLGILLIPFELLALNVIGDALYPRSRQKRNIYRFLLSYLFVLGVVYHGIISFIGIIKKETSNNMELLSICQSLHDPLVGVMGIGFVLLTIGIVFSVVKKEGILPKWILVFNPVVVYALVLLLYFGIPSIGNYLMVAGFNFSIFIFLGATYFALKGKTILTSN